MVDTLNAFDIGSDWVDLNTLTGIAVGDGMIVQNVGAATDFIYLATSESQPPSDFDGIRARPSYPMYEIEAGESTVWARYFRHDRQQIGLRTVKVQIQAL